MFFLSVYSVTDFDGWITKNRTLLYFFNVFTFSDQFLFNIIDNMHYVSIKNVLPSMNIFVSFRWNMIFDNKSNNPFFMH